MKTFIKIDLLPFLNHKAVYDEVRPGDEEYGIEGVCFLKEDFKFFGEKTLNGTEFNFQSAENDNVVCLGQEIPVNAEADKIHIVGFSNWGSFIESFKVLYNDGDEEYISAGLFDTLSNGTDHYVTNFEFKEFDTRIAGITHLEGRFSALAYLHQCTCVLTKQKTIRKIVFPDNMFIHVFAVTLEKEC